MKINALYPCTPSKLYRKYAKNKTLSGVTEHPMFEEMMDKTKSTSTSLYIIGKG